MTLKEKMEDISSKSKDRGSAAKLMTFKEKIEHMSNKSKDKSN
jgi:hypothetical protein